MWLRIVLPRGMRNLDNEEIFFVGWDLRHQVLRPLLAYCTAPDDRWGWLWSNSWNEDWQGKPKYSEKTCPRAILSTTNPTWPDPCANTGRRVGKPATNRLSYGAAYNEGLRTMLILKDIHDSMLHFCEQSVLSVYSTMDKVHELSNTDIIEYYCGNHIVTSMGLCVTYKTGSVLDDWIYWNLIHSIGDYR
jgi:hypothetical protein